MKTREVKKKTLNLRFDVFINVIHSILVKPFLTTFINPLLCNPLIYVIYNLIYLRRLLIDIIEWKHANFMLHGRSKLA